MDLIYLYDILLLITIQYNCNTRIQHIYIYRNTYPTKQQKITFDTRKNARTEKLIFESC